MLSVPIVDICAAHRTTISVSLDGPAEIHDQFRVDLRQRSTHAAVIKGLEVLRAHPAGNDLFSGVLAVVDPTSSAKSVYAYFKNLGVPSVDFLYRDGNYMRLPFGKAAPLSIEYGEWMVRILDQYLSDPAPFRIRILDDLIQLVLGGVGLKEGVGLTDYGILVIDTDGTIKKNDTLKSTPRGNSFERTWRIGLDHLRDIACSPAFQAYHAAQRPTAPACLACQELLVCGGGMVTHRYSEEARYNNPTIFCADQKHLIEKIRQRVREFTLQVV